MPTKPKTPSAHKQLLCDTLRNHLIGFHGLSYAETRKKTYAQLKQLHEEVKEIRWCRMNVVKR
jgi:hypothetical protein